MSDTCHIEIVMRETDVEAFMRASGLGERVSDWCDRVEPADEEGPGLSRYITDEANYAYYAELRKAASAGLAFCGDHCPVYEYSAGAFCAVGGEYFEIETVDGEPVAVIDIETLRPDESTLVDIMAYREALKRVEALWKESL